MLICPVFPTVVCYLCSCWALCAGVSSLLDLCSELKGLVWHVTKLHCRTDAVWGVKNLWERNGPTYTFLWVLKGPFRHTIVFSFSAALTWELDLYKLQKIYVLLHAVPCSVFLQCVKTAAKMNIPWEWSWLSVFCTWVSISTGYLLP